MKDWNTRPRGMTGMVPYIFFAVNQVLSRIFVDISLVLRLITTVLHKRRQFTLPIRGYCSKGSFLQDVRFNFTHENRTSEFTVSFLSGVLRISESLLSSIYVIVQYDSMQ